MRRPLFALLAGVSGCGVTLPEEYLIEDLRILEIRTEPPEIRIFEDAGVNLEANELVSQPIAFTPVRISALIAHPDPSATFSSEWIRCRAPVADNNEGSSGFRRVPCGGAQRERLGIDPMITVDPVKIIVDDVVASGADPISVVTSLAEDPRDLFAGLYANFNLAASVESASIAVDTLTIEGTKRLVIFDPAVVSLVIREARARGPGAIPMIAGIDTPSLCTKASAQQVGAINAYLEARVPNQRPTYGGITYQVGTDTATRTWVPGGPIEMRAGQSLTLDAFVEAESIERYRVIDDNCNLLDLKETMAFSWFTNDGFLSPQITSQTEGSSPDDRLLDYSAPEEIDTDTRMIRIWSVLRDGRGGSDSRVIDVLIRR